MGDFGSYADRVKGGRKDDRFDPMLEEARRAHGTDTELQQQDAEITVKAVLDNPDLPTDQPHPLKASPGEELPEGFSRSYAGFLLRDTKRVIQVSQDIVKQEMNFLATFAVIGCFVEGRPPQHELPA